MNGTTYRMRYIFEDGTWHNSDFVYDKAPLTEVQSKAEQIANSNMTSRSGAKLKEVCVFLGDQYGFPKTPVSSHRPNEKTEVAKTEYARHLASERVRGHLFLDFGGKTKAARNMNIRKAAMQLYLAVSDMAEKHHWMQGFFNNVSHAAVIVDICGNCDGANIVPKTDMMKSFKRWCFQQMDYAYTSVTREEQRWLRIDAEYGFQDCDGGFYVRIWIDEENERNSFPEGETPSAAFMLVPTCYDYEVDEEDLKRIMGDDYAPPCFVAKYIGENAKKKTVKKNVKKTEKGKD